ncbi:hypothetical protein N7495_005765 [Penicillium taxi]|uniref:uncharacterized protein n=1 Tax=Penicillium taxi TaxID=168475 RepID=UPI0025458EC8|nr:uncharacterized protein N7495_005765 [Penicillium taxi]KAJ5894074.1 hypothetical protein N7495_005765 [Penicillium taxi]
MVGLKKLLLAERHPLRPSSSPTYELESDEPYLAKRQFQETLYNRQTYDYPPLSKPSTGYRVSAQSMDLTNQFDQIEKHFEDLHRRLARPQSSQSLVFPTTPKTPNGFGRLSRPKSRHIDLLEAVNTSERLQDGDSQPVSPSPTGTCLYNEDVAERNMTRFLRIQYRSRVSRRLSSLYQEDVADRNIAQYGGDSRSNSSLSCRSLPAIAGWVRDPKKRNSVKSNWSSEENLRNSLPKKTSKTPQTRSHLRLHKSVPALPTEEVDEKDEVAVVPDIQSLGVPPAFKLGRRWSSTPLPDSPTLPPVDEVNGNEKKDAKSIPSPRLSAKVRSSSLNTSSVSISDLRSSSRKNVRDLSINTQLAAQGPKIAHRAISPPTPSKTPNDECKGVTPSIAEIMHSPLPEPSPMQPSPRFKVSEMMDLFNKAYFSTQAVSSHPTYESLQDAIVREINSHEAFRHVPTPDQGPPFTPPSATTISESKVSEVSQSPSPISKLIKKSSFKMHRVNSESHQSVSIGLPAKSSGILRRVSPSASRRRRHTDAPAPSPALFADLRQSNGDMNPIVDDQMTYLDVLVRAGQDKFPPSSNTTRNLDANTPYTHCMQAHSTPSKDSQKSLSIDGMDDDILHLPSPGPPPLLQIEGVDVNNVHYVIDSEDAARLVNWKHRATHSNPPAPICDRSLSPLSRPGLQLRNSRSVETY